MLFLHPRNQKSIFARRGVAKKKGWKNDVLLTWHGKHCWLWHVLFMLGKKHMTSVFVNTSRIKLPFLAWDDPRCPKMCFPCSVRSCALDKCASYLTWEAFSAQGRPEMSPKMMPMLGKKPCFEKVCFSPSMGNIFSIFRVVLGQKSRFTREVLTKRMSCASYRA